MLKKLKLIIKLALTIIFNFKQPRLRMPYELSAIETFGKYLFHETYYANLIKNLDKTSIAIVDRLIARYKTVLKNNLLDETDMLPDCSPAEASKIKSTLKHYRKKYDILDSHLVEVFYYKNGLVYLNKKQINSILNLAVIDGGAFIGDSTLIFNEYGFKKIYAFEPCENIFERLKATIQRHQLKNCSPINLAIGRKSSLAKAEIQLFANKTTIDEFVSKSKLKRVGLIKMDIEGEEYNAILGAKNTIVRDKPYLIISMYHSGRDFFEIKPFLEKICGSNYKFIVRKLNPFDLLSETMLIAMPVLK